VIVHIHDIYLPYDYRSSCATGSIRAIRTGHVFTGEPGKYETICPNYFIFEDEELSELVSPVWEHENLRGVERHGGSFWIRINE